MTYTLTAVMGVAGAVALDLFVLRTGLLRRKAFWTSYAIVLFFQLVVNGLLTGLRIVRYDGAVIAGWHIAFAPVEDVLFGFAMVTATLILWVWLGRRAGSPRHCEDRAVPPPPAARETPSPGR